MISIAGAVLTILAAFGPLVAQWFTKDARALRKQKGVDIETDHAIAVNDRDAINRILSQSYDARLRANRKKARRRNRPI